MKICPICAGPLDKDGKCAICGFSKENVVEVEAKEVKDEKVQTEKIKSDDVKVNSTEQKQQKKQQRAMSVFGIMILLIINACVCATIVNLCLETEFWAHYVTIGLLTVFLLGYSLCTKNPKTMASRLRNTIFVLNIIAGIFMLILFLIGQNFSWIWQYYMPILITFANFVLLALLFLRKVNISSNLITCGVNFILMLCPLLLMVFTEVSIDVRAIIICSFAICLLCVMNLLFIKILQWKHILTEKFTK